MMNQDSEDPTGINGPSGHHTGNSAPRARQRKANAAIGMALAGATWNDIALVLGYPTARTARVAVERALERELKTDDDRDKMRRLAGARLDRLLRSVWSEAINPDSPDRFIAVSKAREIIGDHRKLFGLDAPTEVVVHNPTREAIEAWVAQVTATTLPAVVEYDIIEGEIEGGDDAVQA